MKFFDRVEVKFQAGKGGDGIVAGRREKFVPYGGPAGGDGGKGGNIILIADEGETTLLPFKYKSEYKAQDGEMGKGSEQTGKKGEDLILKVPVGTLVIDKKSGKLIYQFKKHGDKFIAAKGGRGGLGNIHFKNSVRQYPQFALLGEPGEYKEYILELQLLADVGLIGFPNVGKSTFINTISKQKVKVANYPFTTIIPNLGVVDFKGNRFVVVDIPGIISQAHKGKGLGYEFLRHILKAKIWSFILDISEENLFDQFKILFEEIKLFLEDKFLKQYSNFFDENIKIENISFKISFNKNNIFLNVIAYIDGKEAILFNKALVFILNKIDLINDKELIDYIKEEFINEVSKYLNIDSKILIKNNVFNISAAGRININEVLEKFINILSDNQIINQGIYYNFDDINIEKKYNNNYITDITHKQLNFLIENEYIDEKEAKYIKVFEVYHPELSYLVEVLPWGNDEAEMWFWQTLQEKGIVKWLEKYGVRQGDILKIKNIYGKGKDKYILFTF